MNSATLRMHHVSKNFTHDQKTFAVLSDISVTFAQSSTYAITGVSGTGKSTFMHILAGLERPTSGQVTYNQKDVSDMTQHQEEQFLNQSVGLLFQNPYLIAELTVAENTMMPGLIAQMPYDECLKRTEMLLEQVGIPEKADALPATLSGGQQQRVALARALFNKPAFLLADEPTGNLDVATGKVIVDLLLACQREWGMGMIISTHDAYVAQNMQTVYAIKNGALHVV